MKSEPLKSVRYQEKSNKRRRGNATIEPEVATNDLKDTSNLDLSILAPSESSFKLPEINGSYISHSNSDISRLVNDETSEKDIPEFNISSILLPTSFNGAKHKADVPKHTKAPTYAKHIAEALNEKNEESTTENELTTKNKPVSKKNAGIYKDERLVKALHGANYPSFSINQDTSRANLSVRSTSTGRSNSSPKRLAGASDRIKGKGTFRRAPKPKQSAAEEQTPQESNPTEPIAEAIITHILNELEPKRLEESSHSELSLLTEENTIPLSPVKEKAPIKMQKKKSSVSKPLSQEKITPKRRKLDVFDNNAELKTLKSKENGLKKVDGPKIKAAEAKTASPFTERKKKPLESPSRRPSEKRADSITKSQESLPEYSSELRAPKKKLNAIFLTKSRDHIPRSQDSSQKSLIQVKVKVPIKKTKPPMVMEEDTSFTRSPLPSSLSRQRRVKTLPSTSLTSTRQVSPVLEVSSSVSPELYEKTFKSPLSKPHDPKESVMNHSPSLAAPNPKTISIPKLNPKDSLSIVDFVGHQLIEELKLGASSVDNRLQKTTDELAHQLKASLVDLDQNHKLRKKAAKDLALIRKRQEEARAKLLLERQDMLLNEKALRQKTKELDLLAAQKKKEENLDAFLNDLKLLRSDDPLPKKGKKLSSFPESFRLYELKAKLAIAQANAGLPLTIVTGTVQESIASISHELELLGEI